MNEPSTQQVAFDFGDSHEPAFAEGPPGTWLDPAWSSATYRAYFAAAQQQLDAAPPELRPLYEAAFNQALEHLDALDETIEDGDIAFVLPRVTLDVGVDDWCRFVDACSSSASPRTDTVVRRRLLCDVCAVHSPGLGSLTARIWSPDSFALDYQVGRDAEMRPSFRDGAPQYALTAQAWRPYYVGDRLAAADDQPASLRSFPHQAHRYVVTGIQSHRGRSEADAWAITAAADGRDPPTPIVRNAKHGTKGASNAAMSAGWS